MHGRRPRGGETPACTQHDIEGFIQFQGACRNAKGSLSHVWIAKYNGTSDALSKTAKQGTRVSSPTRVFPATSPYCSEY